MVERHWTGQMQCHSVNAPGRILEYGCDHNSGPGDRRADHRPSTPQASLAVCCTLCTDVDDRS